MNPLKCRHRSGRIQRLTPPAVLFSTFIALRLFMPASAWSAGVVTNCTETNLRAALAGGGTVTFACDGTITLANTISNMTDTVLDGSGHQVTISGGNEVRVFYVSTNVTFTLLNLTIANGYSANGGAIYNQYGTVSATNCTFTGNTARDAVPGSSLGGGILNYGGNLNLHDCLFTGNSAVGYDCPLYSSDSGGDGQGGAMYNSGTLVVDNCRFAQNQTRGGFGGVPSWMGGGGGRAMGGAIYNSGSLSISRGSFTDNSVLGESCQPAGTPHHIGDPGITGGTGGAAYGSAIFNSGSLVLQGSTVAANTATGGYGGTGGFGYPSGSTGSGGSGSGAIFNVGTAVLVNTTVALNGSFGGDGNPGGSGFGGICNDAGLLRVTNCTVAANNGTAGSGGGTAVGGVKTVSGVFYNTLLASNTPSNGSGTMTDAGHNLSSDASCAFTAVGSLNSTDPKLGPLANNGGPTWTMALLPGSPAIDAGSSIGVPAIDQRGVSRPQGPAPDIGAFEYQYIPVFTGAKIQNGTNCQLQLAGLLPNQTFILEVSSNLMNWSAVTNFVVSTNGLFQILDPMPGNSCQRFYRLKSDSF